MTRVPNFTVRFPASIGLSAALAATSASVAVASQPVVILDTQLRATTGEIRRITPKGIAFAPYPLTEPERTLAMDDVALIVQPWWWSPERQREAASLSTPSPSPALAARLEMTDGRILAGKLDLPAEGSGGGGTGDGQGVDLAALPKDVLAWDHPILGRLTVRLEDVRRLTMPPPPPLPDAPKTDDQANKPGADKPAPGPADAKRDAVVLLNGDQVRGFVEHVGSEVWVAEGGAGAMTKVPAQRVREVLLVNPPVRPTGARVWLDGAWSVGVDYLGADPQRGLALGIEPAKGKSRQVFVRHEQVIAIVPHAERLTPLAALAVARVTGPVAPSARPFVAPPRVNEIDALLGASDVEIPGPMTVEWALPKGALRLGGWLVLPPAYHEWGDCLVRFESLDTKGTPTEVARESVNADRALVPLNVPLPSGASTLRLTLDAGAYGPIQDRVVLRRMLIVSGG